MIRVTIFEDYTDMREVLSSLIQNSSDFFFAGAYATADNVHEIIKK